MVFHVVLTLCKIYKNKYERVFLGEVLFRQQLQVKKSVSITFHFGIFRCYHVLNFRFWGVTRSTLLTVTRDDDVRLHK